MKLALISRNAVEKLLCPGVGRCYLEWRSEIHRPYGRQGPNCTDFATFNSLSNTPVADPLRPNFGLGPAYLGQLWGPQPRNG